MFDRQVNQVRLEIAISPQGPLLIRSGRTGVDPSRPQLECVRTSFGGRPTVYIPGSSLKGVLRSHSERLLRSEDIRVHDPFDTHTHQAFTQKSPFATVFEGTTPIGRTYGSVHLRGAMAISDLVPGGLETAGSADQELQLKKANATEQRNGVGIDRLLGSAKSGALFDQEVVVDGSFEGRIVLRNVQLYQVALVLFALRDLDEGLIQLGSGTTRGNGWVAVSVRQIIFEHPRGQCVGRRLKGLGELLPQGHPDFFPGDYVDIPADSLFKAGSRMIQDYWAFSEKAVGGLENALIAGPWPSFVAKAKDGRWIA